MSDDKIIVQNVNHPDYNERVNREKYEDMCQALLRILPMEAPGLKVSDAIEALKSHLYPKLFPGGAKSGWWQKKFNLTLKPKS